MRKPPYVAVVLIAASVGSASAVSAELGSAAEAKAMLQKVVLDLKQDKAATLAKITKGEGGFKDRDLYPFCMGPDGITTAHPTQVGTNILELKDKKGKAFGKEMFAVAEEGKFKTVAYMWPKPGQSEPAPKESFVTKVGDQVCGVGYYK
jgi:signal transduction histidine kinase